MFNNQCVSCSEIEKELREKPHVCEFMKEMLSADEDECKEALRLLTERKKEQKERFVALGDSGRDSDFDIPVKPRRPGKYKLTKEDKECLKSLAAGGVIPLDSYLDAMHKILNR